MALLHSMESEGNWLFKHRSYLPLILFILALPAVYLQPYATIFPLKATIISMVAVCLSILGAYIRAYTIGTTPKGTSGRNTAEQVAETLNSTGIYSMVRHPLYLGNYFMWIGIVLYTLNISFVIMVSLMYWLYYERIMFAEERFLEKKFGQRYLDWSLKVPAFIPAFANFVKPIVPFSFISVLRREYSGWLATAIGFVFVDVLRNLTVGVDYEIKAIPYQLIILLTFGLVALILKLIKKHTGLLLEEGRS
ncbi:MAG: DUF1295 domain-containing protein [Bacteroidetes bacterium]|nr:DUF1295 domain-containing protein [Bacteroidota bacterium]